MGSSEDPSLVNNFDELGLVYYGLRQRRCIGLILQETLPTCVKYLVYLTLRDWWYTQVRQSETRHIL